MLVISLHEAISCTIRYENCLLIIAKMLQENVFHYNYKAWMHMTKWRINAFLSINQKTRGNIHIYFK